MPHWLPDVMLGGLRCGQSTLTLHFRRAGEESRWEVVRQEGETEVVDERG